MKKEEIQIPKRTIVLGIFGGDTFNWFRDTKDCVSYQRFYDYIPYIREWGILENVEKACNWAEKIIFVLDNVHFPIDPASSYTCGELKMICKNPEFFNKTVFVKENNVINFDKNLI